MFAGRVKIVGHSSCRTSAILEYFCPLLGQITVFSVAEQTGLNPNKTRPRGYKTFFHAKLN